MNINLSTDMNLTLRDRLRSRNVSRWHTVLVTIRQNIAEHSHCMGIIVEHLLLLMRPDASIEERYAVLKYAQVHDLPEIITGDPSSVFKRFLRVNLPGFDELMDSLERKMVPELDALAPIFAAHPHLPILCKAADLLEAYSYFLNSKGLDEQHNTVILDKLDEYLGECIDKGNLTCPALDWSLLLGAKSDIAHGASVVIDFEQRLSHHL